MGAVILGLPGPWADDNLELSDHYTTKVGGIPDLPFQNVNHSLLDCSQCGSKLCLVLQIYAPVSIDRTNIDERFLLVFGCLTPECGSSSLGWRVLRVQKSCDKEFSKVSQEIGPLTTSTSAAKTNWWEQLDEESDEEMDLEELQKAFSDVATKVSHAKETPSKSHSKTVTKSLTSRPTRVVDVKTPVVPCFYIYTEDEPSSKDISMCSNYASLSLKENQSDEEDSIQEEKWSEEGYEHDKALTADRTYLKFKKKLDAYPEQCLRYSFGGKPILARSEDGEAGKCKACGGSRQFEMQLMPPLLYFLQEAADESQKQLLETWNWMTLLVHTCSESCSQSSEKSDDGNWIITEESTIVQLEKPFNSSPELVGFFSLTP
ncbi:programmed cell death protein 2-like [Cucumis sativus]|uniref:Programmed cell death protein 2 C-terminal domain-containing protein n=1 Tax=Cucumis sativus TaxID=3659 RepID=A0A0A0K8S8_CUCSA|nr:programmed cell death protein 2-like [Cucumis sativus]XP_011656449.1 programmed cell death protein 2-like [Cucumis sativus]XP_031744123.1 programmed cell death protein 2-like [Cucumis sativus]XP_031744124.1 programmed cell death protein 2-like [Cucumis sativus]XP_031744125.1 programmed cell death protein 2-like [Cucumis sativus]XP_031744126.1 programmed cell death protein 2-like [Cucumis sativus]XP_031744127.1 programmed cell death protein 2-like [Cucumis sativus]XP_031744128.1 programmed